MTTDSPLSGRHCPRISLSSGQAGIFQEELTLLRGTDYSGRVVLRGSGSAAPIQVRLVWGEGPQGAQTVTISSLTESFTAYPLAFRAGADTENGRLEIVAHLGKRENRRIEVQANCVFKDQNAFSTGDETPFVMVILTENGTEDVKFTSMNNLAKKYTIRVRQAR